MTLFNFALHVVQNPFGKEETAMKPMEIERRSFEIIASELGEKKLDPE